MKKLLMTAVAGLALAGMGASVANADATTNWTFTKSKLTTIVEPTTIVKVISINVTDTKPLDSAASALVAINSSISGAVVGTAHVVDPNIGTQSDGAPFQDFVGNEFNYDIHRSALITGSVLNNTGIGQLNQDVGNNSNQGNVVAAGFVFGGNDFADAEAYVEQLSTNNSARDAEDFKNLVEQDPGIGGLTLVPLITATLDGSMNNNTGVFMANQNAGNNNQQHNALAAAIGENAFTALADAGLHQVNSGNHSYDINTVKEDLITNSVNSNTGIVAFNQSVGNNNNQATVVNVSAISSWVGLP
ncbi:MAG: hypothetical protein JSR86_04175 [Proteobacteria bacterium]|nr:hypothetical protein [Pseudomonadota bacterium]